MSAPTLIYLLGATNAGKSTFLQRALAAVPRAHEVEVGKMMRAKYLDPASPHYQPDYFKGQAAPDHTEAEAWQMMLDGIAAAPEGTEMILIDGQPRSVKQAVAAATMPGHERMFLHLWAPRHVRQARAEARDKDSPEKLRLSLQRMDNDPPVLYEVLSVLEVLGAYPCHLFEREDDPLHPKALAYHLEHACEVYAYGPTNPNHPALKYLLP